MRKGFALIEMMIVLAIIGILSSIAIPMIAKGFFHSEGSRVGVVTKLSKKGIVCQTWEAQLMVGAVVQGQGGTYTPDIFGFTPKTDAIAADVREAMLSGERVEIVYVQEPQIRTLCTSETGYFAIAVNKTKKG